jgi:hypothetical protein
MRVSLMFTFGDCRDAEFVFCCVAARGVARDTPNSLEASSALTYSQRSAI